MKAGLLSKGGNFMDELSQSAKAEFVHHVFSNIAGKYDTMNSVLSFYQHKVWRDVAMAKMAVRRGNRCLDVATGTGDWAIALADEVGDTGRVVGLDFCEEMLDVARPKVAAAGIGAYTKLMSGNAMELPFADDEFDVVTIGFALRNVPDVQVVLNEMTRVAKPGGMVVSLELSKPTWEPFRSLYYFYFYRILPKIGKLVVGDAEPYEWLPRSLITFPDRFKLAEMFQKAGLERVAHYPLTGGICALHMGYKPMVSGGDQ